MGFYDLRFRLGLFFFAELSVDRGSQTAVLDL